MLNAGGIIYNAPIVAFNVNASDINFPSGKVDYSKVHDQVVAIDPINMTVTINLINGFSFGRPVWYISMDASIPLAATIEHNTYAPLMGALHLGDDDSFSSPIERIFIATNGREGHCKSTRQGLSATWRMVTGPITCWAESRRSRWITVLPGMRTCSNGRRPLSLAAIEVSFAKNSTF